MMRLLFIIFLICLIPARGWTGTAMGMQMAAAKVAASVKSVQTTLQTSDKTPAATMPDDCGMHIGANESPTHQQPDIRTPPCSGCDTCELCLAIASPTTSQVYATPFTPSVEPAAVPHGFFSADHANRLKPPIS